MRVILTTNFDRLMEQALEAEGILPQVVASPAAVVGMEPIAHARCTVIKLHGDYASLEQLNTVEELSNYAEATAMLLDRVLDEYGLIISGWSGDWDHALVAAIERTRSRRYPLFWAAYGDLGDVAKRLVAQHRAQVISGATADVFFPDLVARLEALDALHEPPLSLAMAIAQLKRALPDPTKHIQLRDLMDGHVSEVREALKDRPPQPAAAGPAELEEAHETLRRQLDPLLNLLAHGVYLDRDRQHTDLWVWTIEQLLRARRIPNGAFHPWWDNLQHYPALLALRTASMAAVATSHDDVLIKMLKEPTWREQGGIERSPAFAVLHDYRVLDHDVINAFPIWKGQKWLYPRSHLLRHTLQPVFLPIVGDEASYKELCDRTEYRIALGQSLFDGGRKVFRSAPGEFVGDWQWDSDGLIWEADFRKQGDHAAWGWTPDNAAEMSERLTLLTDELTRSARRE